MADSKYILDAVTAADFPTRVLAASEHQPVLVDFWAAWCQPCQMLMPILARLAEEYAGGFLLAKVNTDQEQALALEYGIRSLPTVKLFRHGVPVDEFMGVQPESVIRAMLDQYVERESDRARAEAADLWAAGRQEQALAVLGRASQEDPENMRVMFDRIAWLTALARFEEAESLLDGLPLNHRETPEAQALKNQIQLYRIAAEAPDRKALEARVASGTHDSEALYFLGVLKTLEGKPREGLEHLLQVVKRDRKFRQDGARQAMLAAFDLIEDRPLVDQFRQAMFRALY